MQARTDKSISLTRPGDEVAGRDASRAISSLQRCSPTQAARDQPVVIEADKNARYEDVLDVLDLLQRNGVKKVGLLARPTPS